MEGAKQFRERVYGYAEKVKQRKEVIKEDVIGAQLKECTFTPMTIQPVEKPRTLEEFLQDQSRFQQRRQDNIAKISEDSKEKAKDVVVSTPQIDENSVALVAKQQRGQSIYERLYAISKKSIQVEEDKKEEKSQPIPASERREPRLYQIAVEKNKEWFEKKAQEANPKKVPTKKDPSVDSMVIQGFTKEFMSAVASVGLSEESKAAYEQMRTILATMWFIKTGLEESPEDEITTLLKKFWNTVKSQNEEFVPIAVLKSYVAAILNIKLIKLEPEEEKKAPEEEKRQQQLEAAPEPEAKPAETRTFSSEEISKIFQDYELFYLTRKSNKPQKRKQPEIKDFQFKPSLCKESVKLAESVREKYASKQEDSKVDKPEGSMARNDLVALADAMVNQKRAHEEYDAIIVFEMLIKMV